VIAALSAWHEQHTAAAEALATVTALPAHALLEVYSVLTRLPSGLAVPPASAAAVLADRFDGEPLSLSSAERGEVPATLAGAGVAGGAAYDGLVALEAAAHGETLLTLDRRAQVTYRRVGAPFLTIDG
jgi:hypothetical protein